MRGDDRADPQPRRDRAGARAREHDEVATGIATSSSAPRGGSSTKSKRWNGPASQPGKPPCSLAGTNQIRRRADAATASSALAASRPASAAMPSALRTARIVPSDAARCAGRRRGG